MTIETLPSTTNELLTLLNTAFDCTKERLGLSSDRELAKHYEVSPKTISFWRTGKWTHSDRVLIRMLAQAPKS